MSIGQNAFARERCNASTAQIDRLSTQDLVNAIHQNDLSLAAAIDACLPDITRLIDNATAALSRGGRVVLVGAGASGRQAIHTARDHAPEAHHPVVGLIAGGQQAMLHEGSQAAQDYDGGMRALQAIGFNAQDLLVALTVNGKTPWVWGALRHAGALGATVAVITREKGSEAAQLADILVAPQTGAEVVAGFRDPRASLAQQQILNMLSTGLAIRAGRVFGNMRVDLDARDTHSLERQIAVVMAAGECSRAVARDALASCNNQCKTAILMVLSGLDAWSAHGLLDQHKGHLRMALQEAPKR
ncbi:N-acetylmuramic acid 6-phosphate etherase [Shimwellia pseudoproteus]|uniref:N-acetylmuramic acid 6-phosphate etherase n=1 Tax=Shimwellia pseudoproteus TaxID=570012 RepID=UPI0018ED6E48|nr:N-acetylmuramic acid 6-phosphate etherase [Shimwellia pseudoproteus]MBJ3813577.1 N-acetylmuramic acid 6-phosphate etherase [Shimwellia pseudoproteus]